MRKLLTFKETIKGGHKAYRAARRTEYQCSLTKVTNSSVIH